jgi:hypothetical protein
MRSPSPNRGRSKAQRHPLALAAIVACVATNAHAQIYKWIDSQGVTHYTSEPPPNTAKPVALPIQNSPAPSSSTATTPSWQDQDSAFRARYDKNKAEQAKKDQQDAANAATRRQACMQARMNVQNAEHASSLYTLDAQGGRVYLSDEQRAQALAGAQSTVQKNCDN